MITKCKYLSTFFFFEEGKKVSGRLTKAFTKERSTKKKKKEYLNTHQSICICRERERKQVEKEREKCITKNIRKKKISVLNFFTGKTFG